MSGGFNVVRVDLAAAAHNLSEARRIVGPEVRVMAAVKADAYGHGLVPVAKQMVAAGADALGVMDTDEAVRLRDAGISAPVFILAGFETRDCDEIVARNLVPFVYSMELAGELNAAAGRVGRKAEIHLKLDTGMHRLGVRYDRAAEFFQGVKDLPFLNATGLATHFPDADLEQSGFIHEQLDRFDVLIDQAGRLGYNALRWNNVANSAAVLGMPRAHYAMVRPGLMLYGEYPAPHFRDRADLRPVMTVASRVIQVSRIPAGSAVSYGRTWRAERERTIATVPIGYGHGFNRHLSNSGHALIRGRMAPVRGRVCMNLTMFDVTDIPGVAPGDEVVVLGRQGGQALTAQKLADEIGTIHYEVCCTFGGLIRREYINRGDAA